MPKKSKRKWRKTKVFLLLAAASSIFYNDIDPGYEQRIISGNDFSLIDSPSMTEGKFEGYKVRTTYADRRPVTYLVAQSPNKKPTVVWAEIDTPLYFVGPTRFNVCFGNTTPKQKAENLEDVANECFLVRPKTLPNEDGWSKYRPIFSVGNVTAQSLLSLNSYKVHDPKIIEKVKEGFELAERARKYVLAKQQQPIM